MRVRLNGDDPACTGGQISQPVEGEMDGIHKEEERKEIKLLTDSQSAKALAENPVYHERGKHILAKWLFVRERCSGGREGWRV